MPSARDRRVARRASGNGPDPSRYGYASRDESTSEGWGAVSKVAITKIECFYVKPRWQFLKVSTDVGVSGWAEAVLEGKLVTVRAAIDELSSYLVGQDPRKIEYHWRRMYTDNFYRGGPILTSALSALDIALWDIKGKLLGAPVHELLGGPVRDAVAVYCHIGGNTPDELIESARGAIAKGYRTFKTGLNGPAPRLGVRAYIEAEVERFFALREALGPDYEFAIDFHGRATPALARTLLKELEGSHPLFVEEPCLPENVEAMAELRRVTPIPIATGERLFTRWGFQNAMASRVADVYQPDVCHAGGISELVKIGTIADAQFAHIAPHNPLGPVALAASLQVDCVVDNFVAQELVGDLGESLLAQPFELKEGMIARPTGPGLGVGVNEEAVVASSFDGRWRHPELSHSDGSVASW